MALLAKDIIDSPYRTWRDYASLSLDSDDKPHVSYYDDNIKRI